MRITNKVRSVLSELVIQKWRKDTGNLTSTPSKSVFLTTKDKGQPKKIDTNTSAFTKTNWSIRDCLLNNFQVLTYIFEKEIFRGANQEEKVAKYNGLKFYQFIYLDTSNDCPIGYLDTYSIYIGYKDFQDFVQKCADIPELESKKQQSYLEDELKIKDKNKKFDSFRKHTRNYNLPEHFLGFYKGYFLKPRIPDGKDNINRFSELTLLITDTGSVFVRTHSLGSNEEHASSYYEGISFSTNDFQTLHLDLNVSDREGNNYELFFVFDTFSRKVKNRFKEYPVLRGIYGGSDITSQKPVAGRMIILPQKTWNELYEQFGNRSEIISNFINGDEFLPLDTIENIINIFDYTKPSKSNNFIRDFFTIEDRYIEDINFVDQFKRSPRSYELIQGDYSLFSLDSDYNNIKRTIVRITKIGEVQIKGSRVSNDFTKTFHGYASLLRNDILSIVINNNYHIPNAENKDVISYLFKIFSQTSGYEVDLSNGVRIMPSADDSHSAFASRVLLLKQDDGFYDKNEFGQKLNLEDDFHKDECYKLWENEFGPRKTETIISLLQGFENNIIKTFSSKRKKNGYIKDINYKLNYLNLAKYHASKERPDIDEVIINLYYSYQHGNYNLYTALFEGDGHECFKSIIDTPAFGDAITIEINDKKVEFIKEEIARIKSKSLNKIKKAD
jgi:hypothetical protein